MLRSPQEKPQTLWSSQEKPQNLRSPLETSGEPQHLLRLWRLRSLLLLRSIRGFADVVIEGRFLLRVIHKGLGVPECFSLRISVYPVQSKSQGVLLYQNPQCHYPENHLVTHPATLLVSPRPLQYLPRLLCHFLPLGKVQGDRFFSAYFPSTVQMWDVHAQWL